MKWVGELVTHARWLKPLLPTVVALLATYIITNRRAARDALKAAYVEWAMAGYDLLWKVDSVRADAFAKSAIDEMRLELVTKELVENEEYWEKTGIAEARHAVTRAAFKVVIEDLNRRHQSRCEELTKKLLEISADGLPGEFHPLEYDIKLLVYQRLGSKLRGEYPPYYPVTRDQT